MIELNHKTQRYGSYKDSGIDWLGKVPAHWKLTRLGTRFEQRKTKVSDKDFPPLSVTKNGTIPQLASAAKSNDGDNRKLVKKGDFVINSRSDRKGSSGIAYQDGSVSLIYIVMEPLNIHPIYCNYLLKSFNFIEEFYRMGHGIVADLWTTRYDEMKTIMVGIPPLAEQTVIAQFLDDKTTKIDEAISIKAKQISLLKERKQILIHKGVSQGLNPNVKLKDSGVLWIGNIPKHWEKLNISRVLLNLEQGDSPSISNIDNGFYALKLSAIKEGKFFLNEYKPINSLNYQKRFQINKNDFLVTRGNTPELVGESCIVKNDIQKKIMFSDLVYRLKFDEKSIDLDFMLYCFQSVIFRRQIIGSARGSSSTMVKVSQGHIKSWFFFKPPLSEQKKISEYIETNSQKIETAISLKQQEIVKLKEYKCSLINEVVTGKVKVA